MNIDFSKVLVAPSVLAADLANMGAEVRDVELAGADWIHLDIMDGHFVDNLSFGPAFCATVRKITPLPIDIHLMIERPDHYLERFLPSADMVTVHVEPDHDVEGTLCRIREAGKGAGLSLRPGTPFEAIEPYLDKIDLLLVMTVEPGFGGQSFMPAMLEKVVRAAAERAGRKLRFDIEVDGGIGGQQAKESVRAGANVLVAGTAVFGKPDRKAAIDALRS